ncbi:hypothetical protein OROHE_005747 [Orobanche hederae]
MLMLEAELWFPLYYAVSNLLNAWTVAPLQLTPNSWLQIICTYTFFSGYRLYRLSTPGEMNFLFKLTKLKDAFGNYYIQGRSGKVVLGVPNKIRGDHTKWFWLAGAWKTVSSDWPSVELDIPTTFSEKNPSPRIPAAADLSLERIKRLPLSERDACYLHTEEHMLVAWVFRFPCHLSIPEVEYPRFHDLPVLEKMAQNLGVLGRLRLGANPNRAPGAAARPSQELKVIPGPSTERRSREEEVAPLTRGKKRKMVEAATLPIKEAPALLIVEQPAKEKALPARQATAQ